MRFKADENLPMEVRDLLRQHGHDALTVADEGLAGIADPAVAAVCQVEKRTIVTLAMDFFGYSSLSTRELFVGL